MNERIEDRPPWVVRFRWLVLAIGFAFTVWVAPGMWQTQHDDDVLAFLPPEHPDVVAFRALADRFGMLSVALVGVRDGGESLLEPTRVESIRQLGRALADLPGVQQVLSFPDLPDAKVQDETLVVDLLVPRGMTDPTSLAERVLHNDNAVGSLVSANGRAAALLVYLASTGDRARDLERIRSTAQQHWSGELFFGGGPFIEEAAATSSRVDLDRLSPLVIAVLAVASVLLLGSSIGAVLNLVVTGLGVVWVVGAHGRFGVPFSIVSSTLPVLMVALGGAFGMHLISGYQRQVGAPIDRASAALRELGWPVVLSGLTTACSFFALVVMPQAPMRSFGIVAGLGVLALLVLALAVVPALLSILPAGWIPSETSESRVELWMPPRVVLVVIAILGIALATNLRADSDTRHVFDPDSEPALSDRFFAEHFGGSQFLQVALEGPLAEPALLQWIEHTQRAIAAIDGVSDVRSLVGPAALLSEGFGGRPGLPMTPDQARRVIANLVDQAPMAQLMTRDGRGALIHVRLAPGPSTDVDVLVAAVREVLSKAPQSPLRVASTHDAAVLEVVCDEVRKRLHEVSERAVGPAEFEGWLAASNEPDAELDAELVALRHRAFGTDELIEPLEAQEFERLPMPGLLGATREQIATLITTHVPKLVEVDPEGIEVVAAQLEGWIHEAVARRRVRVVCQGLGLGSDCGDDALAIRVALSWLEHAEWAVPPDTSVAGIRELPFSVALTGQPVVGQAFAASVVRSLWTSTLVSVLALGAVLGAARFFGTLLPALWALVVTAGAIAALGHTVSVGTSMVTCVSVGAGVDFAIHLAVRGRRSSMSEAVATLGRVVLATGVQLGLAFLVLEASSMPPLRQFGSGLAIGLMVASVASVWFAGLQSATKR